jgi:hypothetical protein
MNAIYSDLQVQMTKVVIDSSSSGPGSSSAIDRVERADSTEPRHRREKSLFVGLKVLGNTRVSGSASEWDV